MCVREQSPLCIEKSWCIPMPTSGVKVLRVRIADLAVSRRAQHANGERPGKLPLTSLICEMSSLLSSCTIDTPGNDPTVGQTKHFIGHCFPGQRSSQSRPTACIMICWGGLSGHVSCLQISPLSQEDAAVSIWSQSGVCLYRDSLH